VARVGEESSVQDFGGKARRKETIRMTEAWKGRWDQNGSYCYGHWLRWGQCGFNWFRIGIDGGLL
jgi:hypothetical protein